MNLLKLLVESTKIREIGLVSNNREWKKGRGGKLLKKKMNF
jgi:hypothetical protein